MPGFSSFFYGIPDVLAGAFLMFSGASGWIASAAALFAITRGIVTISGGGLVDPGAIEYKLLYGGGDFLVGLALPSPFSLFYFARGVASAVGLVL